MARVISDEILKLKIVINGDEGQANILKLEMANKLLSNSISDLNEQQKILRRQRKTDTEEYRNNAQEINRLTEAISDNRRMIDEEIQSMNILSLTMEQLRRRASDLRFTLNHMNPNSAEYAEANANLLALNQRMAQLRTGATASSFSIQELAGRFNHYSGLIAAGMATFAGIAISIQGTIDMNNKLADAQTAVAKTTGLNNEEVKELTKTFSDFDTRTSKMDLLKIAEIGGRLGVPKDEIKDFTKEVDRAYVALGDSFTGGVESVANSLGKIKNLFKETKDLDMATAINQVGSALNELGAAGAASEENVSNFALRLGALPDSLKPSVAETLALGAAFEESGIDAERASSGYSKFVRVAANDTAKFAEVMNLSKKEVEGLINKDPMQFFLKFAEGAKGLDATVLASILDSLKLNDNEVLSVITTASEKTDKFRQTIELSNQALADGTSLTNEFNAVNNNSAAIYDKVKKQLLGIFTSETFAKGLNWIVDGFGKFIGAVEDTEGKVTVFRNTLLFLVKMFAIVATAMFVNNALTGVYNTLLTTARDRVLGLTIIEKARNVVVSLGNVLMTTARAGLWLLAAGYSLVTGNTTMATFAFRGFTAALAANPIGAVITLITALGSAIYYFKQKQDEAKLAAQQHAVELNKFGTIQKEVIEQGSISVDKFKNSTDLLVRTMKSEIATHDQRKKAYESLIKMHPQLADNANKEYRWTNKMAEAYQDLAFKIDLSAKAKARAASKQTIYDEIERDRIKYIKGEASREIEQKERNDFRTKYSHRRTNPDDIKDNEMMLSNFVGFEKHNEGVSVLNKINANQKLLKKLGNADDQYIQNLQTRISKSKGKQKEKLELELSTYYGDSNLDNEAPFKSDYKAISNDKATPKAKTTPVKKGPKTEEDKFIDGLKNYKSKVEELELETQRSRADIIQDGYEQEIAIVRAENRKKLSELEKQKHSEEELAKLNTIISKSKGKEKEKFEAIKTEWLAENRSLSDLQALENEKTVFRLKAIDEKAAKEQLQKDEEIFNLKIEQLRRQENLKIAELDSIEKQKAFLRDKISAEELNAITTFEDGKSYIQRYYQEDSLKLQQEYLQSLVDQLESLPTADLTLEQVAALEAMRNKLAEIAATKASITADKGKNKQIGNKLSSFGGGKDLLGLSPDQWKAMFTNTKDLQQNLQKVGAAIAVVQEISSTYYAFVQANEAKTLQRMEVASDRKKKKLQSELDQGIISQEDYKKQTTLIDAELDKKKAELEYKQAKRQRAIQIAQTIANTALAIMGIWAQFPKADYGIMAGIMSGVVGALGAVQVATIMSQPLPEVSGAEDGLYPVIREQDNKLFNAKKTKSQSGIYNEPTLLVGEGGYDMPELVVSGKAMKRIDPILKRQFTQEVYRAEGFEKGLYPDKNTNNNDNIDYSLMIVEALNRYSDVMENIKKYGIEAYFSKTQQNGKEMQEILDLFNKRIKNTKH